MRQPIALVMGLLMSVLGLVVLAGGAKAAAGTFTLRDVRPTTPGAYETRLDVVGGASLGMTAVRVEVWKYRSREVVATVEDFELVDGTPADGTWRSRSSVTLSQHNFRTVVRMTDAAGTVRSNTRSILYGLQPEIVDLAIGPTTVDIENRSVTYQGRLVHRPGDGSVRPVVGVTVQLGMKPGGYLEPMATTDADGRFSATVVVPYGSQPYRAISLVNDDYVLAASPYVDVVAVALRTRMSLTAEVAKPAIVGETAVLRGRLERESQAGDWAGLPDATIEVERRDEEGGGSAVVGTAKTGGDGTFRLSVPIGQTGHLEAHYNLAEETSQTGYRHVQASVRVNAFYRTKVVGLAVNPKPAGKGAKVIVSGRVTREGAAGSRAVVTGGYLDVEFSRDGRRWTQAAFGHTDQQGYFRIPATAEADGQWRVHASSGIDDNGSDHTLDLDAISGAVRVDVRYRTAVSSFNAAPEPVVKGKTLTVSGVLKRAVNGSTWNVWGGKTVAIYYQVPGSTAWTYAGTAKTTSSGKFVKGFKAAKGATWKAAYKGDAGHLRAESATDYVDVR